MNTFEWKLIRVVARSPSRLSKFDRAKGNVQVGVLEARRRPRRNVLTWCVSPAVAQEMERYRDTLQQLEAQVTALRQREQRAASDLRATTAAASATLRQLQALADAALRGADEEAAAKMDGQSWGGVSCGSLRDMPCGPPRRTTGQTVHVAGEWRAIDIKKTVTPPLLCQLVSHARVQAGPWDLSYIGDSERYHAGATSQTNLQPMRKAPQCSVLVQTSSHCFSEAPPTSSKAMPNTRLLAFPLSRCAAEPLAAVPSEALAAAVQALHQRLRDLCAHAAELRRTVTERERDVATQAQAARLSDATCADTQKQARASSCMCRPAHPVPAMPALRVEGGYCGSRNRRRSHE